MPERFNMREAMIKIADYIIKVDGDRDHMSTSNLTCEFTQEVASMIKLIAKEKYSD